MPGGAGEPADLAASLERAVRGALAAAADRLVRGSGPFAAAPIVPLAFRFVTEAQGSRHEIEISLGESGLVIAERGAPNGG